MTSKMKQLRYEVADKEQGKLILEPQNDLKRCEKIELHGIDIDNGRKIVSRECAKGYRVEGEGYQTFGKATI